MFITISSSSSSSNNDMELLFLSALLLVVLFISLSLKFFVYKTTKSSNSTSSSKIYNQLPPGNYGLPFVGETLQLLSTGRNGVPQKFVLDRMKKYNREVFRTGLFGEPFAVLCGAAGNKFLFSNENKLVNSWWPRNVEKIFPSTPDTSTKESSKKLRKLLPQFLKPEALQRYIGIMDSMAKQHLEDNWDNRDQVLVFPQAKNYTFSLACKLFVSVDDKASVDELSEPFGVLASGLIGVPIDLPGTPFNRSIKASNFIRKVLLNIIKQRKVDLAEKRATATQDILSYMLHAVDDDGSYMNEKDIADKILGLLIGGHDTASAAITFIVKYLAELPEIYELVRKEQIEIAKSKGPGEMLNWEDIQKMKYSWSVACEVLRLAPPLQGSFREAITDFTYAGFTIPKGWKLYWSANTTHMNPDYFPNPEKLDPSRFDGGGPAPYTFVPFGGGPRMCPGKEYARLEILVFMHNIVTRYRWEKLLPSEKIIVDPLPMPAKGLPIRLHAHKY